MGPRPGRAGRCGPDDRGRRGHRLLCDLHGAPRPMTPAVPSPPPDPLPDGYAVRLDHRVRQRADGALLGGSPMRLMRLSARARSLLADGWIVVHDATTAELAGRLLDAGLAVPDLPARRPDDVTVVIPVRDRPAGLSRLLTALRADPATADLPVVVVDDGSVVPVVASDGVRIVRWEESRGPAAARNAGLRTATTAYVAFLD